MKLYMIDKGEYYMEHENVDEAIAFQTACKKVKQIANAIKTIRMKYYPNFAKISDEDKQTYEELHLQIDKIARENGLNMLKTELIADINDRFQDSQNEADANKQEKPAEKILKAYYGAIDAGNQALSEGKLRRALNGKNYTPKTYHELLHNFAEEITDVELCIEVLLLGFCEKDCYIIKDIKKSMKEKKLVRWLDRLKRNPVDKVGGFL